MLFASWGGAAERPWGSVPRGWLDPGCGVGRTVTAGAVF
jgi:rubredoxin